MLRTKLASLIVALVLPATAFAGAPSPALLKAAEARATAAHKVADVIRKQYSLGVNTTHELFSAQRAWFIAYREAPFPAAKEVEAATTYRAQIDSLRTLVEARFKKGEVLPSAVQEADAYLAEADYFLEEARAR